MSRVPHPLDDVGEQGAWFLEGLWQVVESTEFLTAALGLNPI